MRRAARVQSIDALKDFKRALGDFGTLAKTALSEAQVDVQRTLWWIEHDQLAHWQNERRKRAIRLAQAKSELFRAQASSSDELVHATLERKAVEKTQRLFDEAETKIKNVKRWSRLLEREVILYKGHCQPLARAIEGDLPRALVKLDNMIQALEKYVKLDVPRPSSDPTASPATASEDQAQTEAAAPRPATGEPRP